MPHTYTYQHIYMHTHTHIHTHTHMKGAHTPKHTHTIHTYIRTYTYTHTYIHKKYIRTYIHTHTNTYIHTYIHTHQALCRHVGRRTNAGTQLKWCHIRMQMHTHRAHSNVKSGEEYMGDWYQYSSQDIARLCTCQCAVGEFVCIFMYLC